MEAFFIPTRSGRDGESTYQRLRLQTELRMGHAPSTRRIREVWTRRGNIDCITTVGQPDPICGDLVIAIFDMGRGKPFIVYHQDSVDPQTDAYAILRNNAYTVAEFVA